MARKKNFLIYSFTTYIRKFFFQAILTKFLLVKLIFANFDAFGGCEKKSSFSIWCENRSFIKKMLSFCSEIEISFTKWQKNYVGNIIKIFQKNQP